MNRVRTKGAAGKGREAPSGRDANRVAPSDDVPPYELVWEVDHWCATMNGWYGGSFHPRYDLPPSVARDSMREVRRVVDAWAREWRRACRDPMTELAQLPDALPCTVAPLRENEIALGRVGQDYLMIRDPRSGSVVTMKCYERRYPTDPRSLESTGKEWLTPDEFARRHPREAELHRQATVLQEWLSDVADRATLLSRIAFVPTDAERRLVRDLWARRVGHNDATVVQRIGVLASVGFTSRVRDADRGRSSSASAFGDWLKKMRDDELESTAFQLGWVYGHTSLVGPLRANPELVRTAIAAWPRRGGPRPKGEANKDSAFVGLLDRLGLLDGVSDKIATTRKAATAARALIAKRFPTRTRSPVEAARSELAT